ncbi:GNAT family N-acetyltransferase [Leeuwenhoekiella sp. A16]|uniref:GNAT family N-acetyltransferase n=1 Tax=unclassified Leeuwenhoekiella TaxID=2615029 RepID=UPI003A80ECFC|tara:strand:- start:2153 stop:3271 length:1119 start_codon:yes stop_codon:yes gene_type:complete
MITIKELKTKQELTDFVKFPFSLYKNEKNWVPSLINDELESMDADKNPVFKNASAWYFMAYRKGKPVGRIAAIVNQLEIKDQNKPKMRFGWFDVIDDVEVTKALIAKVEEIGRNHQLEWIEGPVGFSNMEKAGILIEGFDYLNTMITWYNFPYYKDHFEELGFDKAAEWVEFKIKIPKESPEKVAKFARIVVERYKLNVIHFTKSKEIMPYVDDMFGLLNKTYNTLSTFVPIQQYQIDHYKEKYIKYINPHYIKCIADSDGKLIAFAITMPSFSKALKKANGKLFPFGIFHLLRARKKNNTAAFYLIGIDPEYQGKGVTAVIFHQMQELFNKNGITDVETNPELEENKAIQQLWKNYEHSLHKRRRTYKRDL